MPSSTTTSSAVYHMVRELLDFCRGGGGGGGGKGAKEWGRRCLFHKARVFRVGADAVNMFGSRLNPGDGACVFGPIYPQLRMMPRYHS